MPVFLLANLKNLQRLPFSSKVNLEAYISHSHAQTWENFSYQCQITPLKSLTKVSSYTLVRIKKAPSRGGK